MSIEVQRRYGTTAEHETFTGALAEITIDTDKNVVVVHDGITAGGFPQDNARKILNKDIDIADFTGLDGYILAYDETEDKFYLKKDDGGGGGGKWVDFIMGLETLNILSLTDIDKPI